MKTFNESLDYEKSQQKRADEFYKNVYNPVITKRYSSYNNNPNDKYMQDRDVDISIECDGGPVGLYWLNVSEKFRSSDFGDMFIELWSDFKKGTPGWAVKESNADCIYYQTPKNSYIVWENSNWKHLVLSLNDQWTRDKILSELKPYEDVYKGNICAPIDIDIFGKKCKATLCKTYTRNEDGSWYFGIGIAIKWKNLKNDAFLNIYKYNNSFKKEKI